jgi:urease accessory protein
MRMDEVPNARETARPMPALERARGELRLTFRRMERGTAIARHFEEGSAKARLLGRHGEGPAEAVIINTSGGMTGGDSFRSAVTVGEDGQAVIASQAAERIYRRRDGLAAIETQLSVASGGRLDWLPQETIVFDRSALRRRVSVDCARDATLLALEATVLGRQAMGETVETAAVSESWRVRREGKLVFADGTRLPANPAKILSGGGTGGGARAFATLVLLAPDAEAWVESARAILGAFPGEAGVSAWNGMLIARLLAGTGQELRRSLAGLVEALRGAPMPRVWNC